MGVICQLARVCHADCTHKFEHDADAQCSLCSRPRTQSLIITDQNGEKYDLIVRYDLIRGHCIDYKLWKLVMGPGIDFVSDGIIFQYKNEIPLHDRLRQAISFDYRDMETRVSASTGELDERSEDELMEMEDDPEWEAWMEEQVERMEQGANIPDDMPEERIRPHGVTTERINSDPPHMRSVHTAPRLYDREENDPDD